MYSWEINNIVTSKNNSLNVHEYLEITNLKSNPQICRITYNAYDDNFSIYTNDGYSWTIKVTNNN